MNIVRHAARELAINILYIIDTSDRSTEDAVYDIIDRVRNLAVDQSDYEEYALSMKIIRENPDLVDDLEIYTKTLVYGARGLRFDVDDLIESFHREWTADRIEPVVKSIIGIAMYEMSHVDDIPVKVAINEALDFARMYAGDEPVKFLNAILQEHLDSLELEEPEVSKNGKNNGSKSSKNPKKAFPDED